MRVTENHYSVQQLLKLYDTEHDSVKGADYAKQIARFWKRNISLNMCITVQLVC